MMFGTFLYCWSVLFCFTAFSVTSFSIRKRVNKHPSNSTFGGKDPARLFSDLFSSFSRSSNIRGGNSKFQYFPPKNYREIYIYQLAQFEEELKNSNLGPMFPTNAQDMMIMGELARSQIPEEIQKNPATGLELSALLDKFIFIVCKWAMPLPPAAHPLAKLEQCSHAELKSVLT